MEPDVRLLESPVFREFAAEEVTRLLECAGARQLRLEKGGQLSGGQVLGVLLSGSLSMTRYDAFGNRFLLENIEPGEVFGLAAALTGAPEEEFTLLACSPCELVLMHPGKFLGGCETCCISHRKLYFNLMRMLAEKNLGMIRKQYHMAQRTLRRKLSSFLSEQSGLAKSRRFTVRMDRQELADYLGVDRSALCAEHNRMKKEGLLDYYRHDFCLKDTLLEEPFEL